MSLYRVADGTQVNVDGVIYSAGEPLPDGVRPGQLDPWLVAGWVVPVADKPTRAKRTPS